MAIEALSQSKKETLTDTEKRIFLSAMGRERRVCEQLEKESAHIPADRKIPLVPVVDEIERKVKTVLWGGGGRRMKPTEKQIEFATYLAKRMC